MAAYQSFQPALTEPRFREQEYFQIPPEERSGAKAAGAAERDREEWTTARALFLSRPFSTYIISALNL